MRVWNVCNYWCNPVSKSKEQIQIKRVLYIDLKKMNQMNKIKQQANQQDFETDTFIDDKK